MGSSTLLRVSRYYETLKHLRVRQFVWRPYLHLRRKLYSKSGYLRARHRSDAQKLLGELTVRVPGPFRCPSAWAQFRVADHVAVAKDAERRQFTFLNRTERFEGEIAWTAGHLSQLWKYNLQYHAYLVALGIAYQLERRPETFRTFREIVLQWRATNPLPWGDAWHPYPVSLRVVNWVMAASLFRDSLEADPEFHHQLKIGLVEQLIYLYKNLEHDVGGNHLLENIKALCVGGAYFSGPAADRWLYRGLSLLKTELARQVLPDGGHYERSPMYHAIVLEVLVVIGAALQNAGIAWPPGLREKLGSMARFHREMLHPDGGIALFNDSAFGIAPDASSLLAITDSVLAQSGAGQLDAKHSLLGRPSPESERHFRIPGTTGLIPFPESGYFVIRKGGNAWVIDVGPVCPDDLPAHAHADILSYELSIHTRRWIVDSGVKEYASGEWRDYARSTRAHNTVSIAGRNQVDVWSAFRVGRRVKPTKISWTSENGISTVTGRHQGFGAARSHTRLFVDINSEAWLVIDEVCGSGTTTAENFIHFHPDVQVTPNERGALLSQHGQTVHLLATGFVSCSFVRGTQAPLNGWYMPEFGVAQPRTTAVCVTHTLPSLTAYVLTTRTDVEDLSVQSNGNGRVCSFWCGNEYVELRWDAETLKPTVRRKQR